MGSDERFKAAGGSEPCNFTWFESYTKAMLKLPTRELQEEFVFGVIAYGSFGTEPLFDYPLDMCSRASAPTSTFRRRGQRRARRDARHAKRTANDFACKVAYKQIDFCL